MTLNSGQVFHWKKCSDGFVGLIGDFPVSVVQAGEVLRVSGSSAQLECKMHSSLEAVVSNYFALDHPLADICASFPNDPEMNAARSYCQGLRIIRQPKWECLATFICSSMKQVAHIRQISHKLRKRFGEPRKVADQIVYTFPSAERVAATSENELGQCGLGYRAKNLLATARQIASGALSLESLTQSSDPELHASLCELPGVGAKVANCVMLFAYERLGAFPIDVWIERVLREKYFPRARKLNAARMQTFTREYFGAHGGYAQQYLFHHARTKKRLEGRAPSRPRKLGRRGGRPSMTRK